MSVGGLIVSEKLDEYKDTFPTSEEMRKLFESDKKEREEERFLKELQTIRSQLTVNKYINSIKYIIVEPKTTDFLREKGYSVDLVPNTETTYIIKWGK